MQPSCSTWSGQGTVAVELLVFDDPVDENGLGYYPATAHARLIGPDALPGPWVLLGEGWQDSVLTPTLAIESPGEVPRILFRRPGGLGDTVLVVGRATAGGALELGRAFPAGGQPCD